MMRRVVVPCPICGGPMAEGQRECGHCARLGWTLIDAPTLHASEARTDQTPDLVALLAFLNGLFAIIFTLLGGAVHPYLGAYLGLVTSATGLGCGVAGVIRTRPRQGRPGRWLAVVGIIGSVANLVLVVALSMPLAMLYSRLFRVG